MSPRAAITATAPSAAPDLRPKQATAGELDVGEVFDEHAAWMHRVARRMTGSTALADDVVQEVFVLLHRRRREIDPRLGLRTWLYRATFNVVRQRRRGDRRYDGALARFARAPEPAVAGPEAAAYGREQGHLVRACVSRLSDDLREVFVMFELEEVSGAEIAHILDIPVNTVWSRLRLAREDFREEWVRLTGGAR